MHARRLVAVLFAAALAAAGASAAKAPYAFDRTPGTLPKSVVPAAYALTIVPDVAAMTFRGHETVGVTVRSATATVVLEERDLSIDAAQIDGGDAAVTTDAAAETMTLTVPHPLAAGAHTLALDFHGAIGTTAEGIYALRYTHPDGSPATMVSTMFESADARRMFPSFDEPAFRASMALSIVVPKAWTAIANMPIAQRVKNGETATIAFAPSPPMATYLVHVTAGDYAALHGSGGRVPQSVWAPAGTERDGAYALAVAQAVLPRYETYFAQPFPLPKLDHIAIPGGFAGAMENWGAIAYRNDLLLVGPTTAFGARSMIARDIAHEMAHQWFGDLVTMAWWDDLWLNESFADWLAIKTTAALNPSWHVWRNHHLDKEQALRHDALRTTGPIYRPVANAREFNSQFDGLIQYVKGRNVLAMFEAYVGPDEFRSALRAYMAAHRLSNTTSADLWAALDHASGKPISRTIATWIDQPGFPLVRVASHCVAGRRTVTLTQQRFLEDGSAPRGEHWDIPIAYAAGNAAVTTVVLGATPLTLPAGRCDEPFRANAGDLGWYRVAFDAPTFAANVAGFTHLPPSDALPLVGDAFALARAGGRPSTAFLQLVRAARASSDPALWKLIAGDLDALDDAENGRPERAAFRRYALGLLQPALTAVGWDVRPGETPDVDEMRGAVLALAGRFGDPAVVREAQRRFAASVTGTPLSPDQQAAVFGIVGRHADAATFERLRALAGSRDRNLARRALFALVVNEDPALRRRALDDVLSPLVPPEDAQTRFFLVLASAAVDPRMAWDVFTANEDALLAPLPELNRAGSIIALPGTFGPTIPFATIAANAVAHVPAAAPRIAAATAAAERKASIDARLVAPIDVMLARGSGAAALQSHR